ncbi:MAG TPA: hypothetical protein VLF21_01195 [Candidatus Saccharimonadales bacterium]|nr:hypothetical protein [Candidatus Saccharimonadales bacterium]
MKVKVVHLDTLNQNLIGFNQTQRFNYLPYGHDQLAGQIRIVQRIQVLYVLLGYNKYMQPGLGMNILEGHGHVVFPNQFIFISRKFTKKAIFHALNYAKQVRSPPFLCFQEDSVNRVAGFCSLPAMVSESCGGSCSEGGGPKQFAGFVGMTRSGDGSQNGAFVGRDGATDVTQAVVTNLVHQLQLDLVDRFQTSRVERVDDAQITDDRALIGASRH